MLQAAAITSYVKHIMFVQHIDTAKAYGNEEGIGSGLQQLFKEGTVMREDLFVTSKLWNEDHASSAVLPALQTSLSKLQLDYLDLYLIHWCVQPAQEHSYCQCIATVQLQAAEQERLHSPFPSGSLQSLPRGKRQSYLQSS